jgi:hypothetical protein
LSQKTAKAADSVLRTEGELVGVLMNSHYANGMTRAEPCEQTGNAGRLSGLS